MTHFKREKTWSPLRSRGPLALALLLLLSGGLFTSPQGLQARPAVKKLSHRKIRKLPGWKRYKKMCSDCHGKKGDGRGPLAVSMDPAPADYRNCDIIGHLSDEQLRKVILEGGPAIGKSKAMQGFRKKLKDPKMVDELIEVIRSFGGCAHQGTAQ